MVSRDVNYDPTRKPSPQVPVEKFTFLLLVFPAMHEHQSLKIVPTMSHSTHLLSKSEFIFFFERRTFFDGELKNFPNGTIL